MSRGISTNVSVAGLADCLRLGNIAFVCRYYSTTTGMPQKRLTPAEAKALMDQGINLVAIYEDGPTNPDYFKDKRGERDGLHAHRYAVELGQPEDSAIYFAVDYDATADETHGVIAQYFKDVREGLAAAAGGTPRYRIGVYGSGQVCAHIKETLGIARYAMLAESHGWAGHDYPSPNLRQEIAATPLCTLSPGVHGTYEDTFANGDYGGFSTLQANIDSMLKFAEDNATPSETPSEFVNRIVDLANQQYQKYHQYVESDSPLKEQIRTYWQDLGYVFPGVETAWSAVFVSWLMRMGGAAPADFKASNAHSRFVYWAIANARAERGLFRGYPIESCAPRVGDLIHNNRGKQKLDFAFAATHEAYESHSALVVALGRDASGAFALTVGGNEGDTVGRKRVPLGADGKILQRNENPFICVVRNLK